MDLKLSIQASIAAAGGIFFSLATPAATLNTACPDTVITTDREFQLSTEAAGAVCLDFGSGNVNGNNDVVTQLGYLTLDTSDDTKSGALPQALTLTPDGSLAGTFSIDAPGYTDFLLAFKTGQGQLNPDWVVFAMPLGVTAGSYAISGRQGLSHVNLYARVVPIPAAGWLFGAALMGLVSTRALGRSRV